jgi:hypothetical protein
MKKIICIKWGSKYGSECVNRIHTMIARFTTPPFQLYCFTDDTEGIHSGIECRPLPELGCPPPQSSPGKWRKTGLWGHTLYDITGTVLFIDLDSVITGSLDDFFTIGSDEDVFVARNWVKPLQRLGQTSVFRFTIGKHGYLLDQFREDPEGVSSKYVFEQHFVTKQVKGGVKFWPNGWVLHFRLHCLGPWWIRFFREAKLPPYAKIVTFPGMPLPEHVVDGKWRADSIPCSPLQHFKNVWNSDRTVKQKWRDIQLYAKPVSWIRETWGK